MNPDMLDKITKNKPAASAAIQVIIMVPTPVTFADSSVDLAGTSFINTDNDTWTELYREGEKAKDLPKNLKREIIF